ncbi:MAG: hypothetical protein KJZ53_02040 [Anaerolineales bacterium]|nr:hypothetical protein [Anaerolineales bacterium]
MPKLKHFALAGAFFLLLALLFTYPLILDFTDSIVGGTQGDGIYFVWLVRWYQGFFTGENAHIFFNPMMNYPQGWNLSTTDTSLAALAPSIPFSMALGPVAGYNIGMWLSFVFSGLAMYAWVYRHTRSHAASLLAGTIYAFFPNRIAHYTAGHLNLSATAWFPLYFMGLYEVLRAKEKFNWGWMALCAVSLGLIAFTSMYYLLFTLLITVIFLAGYVLFESRAEVRRLLTQPANWLRGAATVALSAPFLYMALRPFLSLAGQGGLADRSVDYMNEFAANITDFLAPASSHFLLGGWISDIFDRSQWIEGSLYVGMVTLALVVLAFVWKKQLANKPLLYISALAMLGALVIAMGPHLHWDRELVLINGERVPLPSLLLYNYVPFFAKMRAIMRMGLFTLLFAAFVAGVGADLLLKRIRPQWRGWAAAGLIALALFEFYPGTFYGSIKPVEARPVDYWLAEQPGQGAVVQLPFSRSVDQEQVYYALTHKKPFTGGFFNANQTSQFHYLAPILERFPDEHSVNTLREYQVEFIVIDPADYPDFAAMQDLLISLGLEPLTQQGGLWVYTFSE